MELVIISVWLTIVIGAMVFWIWALIDCINNESTEGNAYLPCCKKAEAKGITRAIVVEMTEENLN